MTRTALVVGVRVSTRVEQGVVDGSATAAADHVGAFVAPLGEDFEQDLPLSGPARRALEEIFASPALADRIVSDKIRRPDGLILMASVPQIIGERFEESEDLKRAWKGDVAASYGDFADAEDDREAALGIPLLEVYNLLRASLDRAQAEIRALSQGLSRGLAIPDLDAIDMAEAIERAVQEHRKKTGMEVTLCGTPPARVRCDCSHKLCVCRFLQETLSNTARHAGTNAATLRVDTLPDGLSVAVGDLADVPPLAGSTVSSRAGIAATIAATREGAGFIAVPTVTVCSPSALGGGGCKVKHKAFGPEARTCRRSSRDHGQRQSQHDPAKRVRDNTGA